MKDRLCPQHDLGLALSRMHVQKLKITREKERIIARALCEEGKATLGLSMTSSGVGDVWTRFLHELRKSEVRLRLLNEEIGPFIDVEYLDEEYCTNVEFAGEMIHFVCQLYYRLKHQRCDAIEPCQIMKKLRSSTNFNEFFTMTELLCDPRNLETPEEQAIFPETSLPSDLLSQTECENKTPFRATPDILSKHSLLLCLFEELPQMTDKKSKLLVGGRNDDKIRIPYILSTKTPLLLLRS